jgi:hypothetical protein
MKQLPSQDGNAGSPLSVTTVIASPGIPAFVAVRFGL